MNTRSFIFLALLSTLTVNSALADISAKRDSLLKLLSSANDTTKVNLLNNLATLVIYDNPEEALKYGKEALKAAEQVHFKKGVSESLNSIGLFYYYIDNYETAITYYTKSIKNSEASGDDLLTGVSNLRLGDVYLYMEDYAKAIEYYDRCIPVFEAKNDKRYLKDAANNKAIACYFKGDYDKALEYYLKVLRIKEDLNIKYDISETLLGIGNVYLAKNNYENALSYYKQAFSIGSQLSKKQDMFDALNNMGIVSNRIGKYDEAIDSYSKALAIGKEIGDDSQLSNPLMNIGLVYSKINQYSKAIEYYDQALKINKELGLKQKTAATLINIGVLMGKEEKYPGALMKIKEGYDLAREIGNKEQLKTASEELSLVYSKMGDYKKAFDFHKMYSEIKDTLLNEANSKAIAEMQTKYETDKKEQEIKSLTMDKELQAEKQKKERTIFMAAGAMVLIVIFFVLNGYFAKQKANKALEEKNVAINKQKEQIEHQKEIVEHKNKEITDSINYAKKIQEAILPTPQFVNELLPESFVFFQPKDIVSGDFYWFARRDGKMLFAAADCTGHGVPGALMSMIGSNVLNEIVNEKKLNQPAEILNQLHLGVRRSLKQDAIDTQSRDGMDIALCSLDPQTGTLEYAGANRSLYLIKNGALEVTRANKVPIGGRQADGEERKFTNHTFQVKKGDMVYLSSDGYADQFGGKNGKKFMEKNFKDMLLRAFLMPIEQQKNLFTKTINDWRGDLEQIDDILLIGVRIS